jgi:hypothetical protein
VRATKKYYNRCANGASETRTRKKRKPPTDLQARLSGDE